MTATPEQEPVPSRIDQSLPLIDRLQDECDSVGSVGDYIYALGISFNALEEHRANMLQLQRAARFVIDPKGHESEDSLSTDAFYWGEILGYTVCDRMIGEEWPTLSRGLIDRDYIASHDLQKAPYIDDDLGMIDPSAELLGELEEMDTVSPPFEALIGNWAEAVTDNPHLQHHMILGFRYIMKQVIGAATSDVAIANECQSMLESNDIDSHYSPEIIPIDEIRQAIMTWYADHFIDLKIKGDEELDKYIKNSHDLSFVLNLEMKSSKALQPGDVIQASGEVLVVTTTNDEAPETVQLFDRHQIVEGDYVGLRVFEAPTEAMVHRLKAIRRGEAVSQDTSNITQPYAVMMEIANPLTRTSKGKVELFPDNVTVHLVLSNNQMNLSQYVL